MTNLERLQLETKGITLSPDELSIYLAEEGVSDSESQYEPTSHVSKRKIYSAALAILNSIANNPSLMKNYKEDDISVSDFAESLQNRIDQLERQIRMMSVSDDSSQTNTFMLFNS